MTGSSSGRARLAAGMLEAVGALDEPADRAALQVTLDGLLDASTLWRRTDDRAGEAIDTTTLGAAARWQPPRPGLSSSLLADLDTMLAERITTAWEAGGPYPPWLDRSPVLRLTVRGRDAVRQLDVVLARGVKVGRMGVHVVPLLAKPALRFAWRWPMRVGVLAGPRAVRWSAQMARSEHHGMLYDVDIVNAPHDGDLEILIVDGSAPVGAQRNALLAAQAACVIVVGARQAPDDLLDRAAGEIDPAIAAGVMAGNVEWFVPFVRELSHDQPVDVALALSRPSVRVAGEPYLVTLTAVGRWAAAVAAEHPPVDRSADELDIEDFQTSVGAASMATDDGNGASQTARDLEFDVGDDAAPANPVGKAAGTLSRLVRKGDFTFESHAATEVTLATRSLVGTPGELVVERRMAMAMAPPPDEAAAEPPPAGDMEEPEAAAPPIARRLFADITAGDVVQTRTLQPDTDHQLEVQIAVPETPVLADEGVEFDERGVPASPTGVARLDIAVTCAELGLRAEQPLDLPTADRSRPSSVAVFPFHTGPEGSLLTFDVVVLHQNRPIREARVLATVRAIPTRRDRVQALGVPLSAIPEPEPDATPGDLTLRLELDGVLHCRQTGGAVAVQQGEVGDLLDLIEQRASAVLAGDEPIVWTPGERAPDLLVTLARLGSELQRKLARVDVAAARTIALTVPSDASILPIELAYAGKAPRPGAKLCRHDTAPDDGPCPKASPRIVCPYAFWGTYRTVARVISSPPTSSTRPIHFGPLHLRPALYAAADKADKEQPAGTPDDQLPSTILRRALHDAVGTPDDTIRSWRAWRKEVRLRRPEFLVALAHSELIDGEPTLEIGRQSVLAQPDIDDSFVVGSEATAPLVLLMACASGVPGRPFFGALPATFAASGAAAVIATLSKLRGPDGAAAAAAVVAALTSAGAAGGGTTLGVALTSARRTLIQAGLMIGLLLVGLGEIDVKLKGD